MGALVVLVTALSQGLTGWRRRQLHRTFGVSRRTLRRWQRWWRELFPVSAAWRNARGRFIPAVSPWHLPASLLERFGGADLGQTLIATLRFLAALSIDSEHAR
ncbi:MAG: hypothetical protein GWN37_16700 [Gammaproteobacteria bacterium]|nr:hypothetical protein [Gammaproteobacteria bacterium]